MNKSYIAVLCENNIAVDEISIPYKHYIIRVPVLERLVAVDYAYKDSLALADVSTIKTKEYEFSHKSGNGKLIYNLRKESKKMKVHYHNPQCRGEKECCDKTVGEPYYFILIGFYLSLGSPQTLHRSVGQGSLPQLLKEAEWKRSQGYNKLKVIAFDLNKNTVYCKDVHFEEKTITKVTAKLC